MAPAPKEVEVVPPEAQIGGKGSERRKSKPVQRSNVITEKEVVDACRKGGMQEYTGIEEAAVIMQDGSAVKFKNPKLLGSQPANAWCLLGATTATRREMLAPDMQGHSGAGGAGVPRAPMNNAGQPSADQMQQIMTFLSSKGFTQEDLQNPTKQAEISAALQSSGLMPGMPAGAPAAEAPSAPSLTSFEDVADDAD